MKDQALTSYQDILEKIKYSLQFLKEEFNYIPKTARYLDLYGASSGNTHLLAKLDYNFLIIDDKSCDSLNNINRIFLERIESKKS